MKKKPNREEALAWAGGSDPPDHAAGRTEQPRSEYARRLVAFADAQRSLDLARARGAGPFLKWAGGKRKSLPQILARIPHKIDTYVEPFVGGGAVFFALASGGHFKKAVISDTNPDLINCYLEVRDNVQDVLRALRELRYEDYYEIRSRRCHGPEAAARVIFLNKTCLNGLWRVNRRGEFNVPCGTYENPKFLDEAGLLAASEALHRVEIRHGDFEPVVEAFARGWRDFVYLDPPYDPVAAGSFGAYTSAGFADKDQYRLYETFARLSRDGVGAMLSNADTGFIRLLYEKFRPIEIPVKRSINSKASGRGAVQELLISNYMPSNSVITGSATHRH